MPTHPVALWCVQDKDMDKLKQLGGVAGLASTLQSHAHNGLDPGVQGGPASIEEHRRVYGANTMPTVPQKNFFMLCFENVQDPIILLLIAAALVSNRGAGAPSAGGGVACSSTTHGRLWVALQRQGALVPHDCSKIRHSHVVALVLPQPPRVQQAAYRHTPLGRGLRCSG